MKSGIVQNGTVISAMKRQFAALPVSCQPLGVMTMRERDALSEVQHHISQHLAARGGGRCLEAGCGSSIFLAFPDSAQLVGIDISEEQLSRNNRVHEKIVADLQSMVLRSEYDLITCVDVIEHLERPDLALANMISALAPGGLLMLKAPNPESLKGFLTRRTPLGFHVFLYRHIFGYELAGIDGRGPFLAPMKPGMWLGAVLAHAKAAKLDVVGVYTWDVGDGRWFARMPWVRRVYKVVRATSKILMPRLSGDSEFLVLVRRPV